MTQVSPDMVERAARAVLNEIYNANQLVEPIDFDTAMDDHRDECTRIATAALTAALGDKYVIVPIEPTRGMLDAAYVSATLHGDAPKGLLSPRNKMRRRYRAMIAAAPTPEQQQ